MSAADSIRMVLARSALAEANGETRGFGCSVLDPLYVTALETLATQTEQGGRLDMTKVFRMLVTTDRAAATDHEWAAREWTKRHLMPSYPQPPAGWAYGWWLYLNYHALGPLASGLWDSPDDARFDARREFRWLTAEYVESMHAHGGAL